MVLRDRWWYVDSGLSYSQRKDAKAEELKELSIFAREWRDFMTHLRSYKKETGVYSPEAINDAHQKFLEAGSEFARNYAWVRVFNADMAAHPDPLYSSQRRIARNRATEANTEMAAANEELRQLLADPDLLRMLECCQSLE